MNPIAQRSLDRARETPASKLLPPIQSCEPLPDLVITGPINRVMELEGKRFALEVVQALGSSISNPSVVKQVIDNLTRTAVAQPSSYASGIKLVIDLLKGAP